ncbi:MULTISPECIES: M4 family metallopeptidase [Streptomyces]|uniref:Neutral metalloproteinase n=2 Tax=Streptomyces TaxID=1883 RepID=A0AA89Q7B0_STRCU|nr:MULTISPECIES: M4 family metallopeptidase [Streptomyces]MBB5813945.1 Zn-dependent metalloprotease [Streptomyces collinus]MEC7056804.1 M4 family metallopeptidase [Streptomyces violaceochromogenes]WMX66999.1 M4 family metallopeptidase [Streptomyces collinus]GHC88971.1 peptidase [Streptomyces violaceochromogenes]
MTSPLYARHKRATLAIATAVAAGALLTTGLTPGSSVAADSAGKPALAAAPVLLSAPARTALIQEQQADATRTADEIGLGAQEKLVVRDVVKDADGSVHTRYERTYAGLPVLGGDLVVHESKSGAAKGVTRATKATLKVATLKPAVTAAKAEKQAVTLAKAAGSEKTEANSTPRKVIWAADGKPTLAYETVVGGLQEDGTPNELHVVTDAASGKKLYEYQAIETGTGTTTYSGKVDLTTTKSGSTYNLTDGTRGGHKTYNLNRGTSGTGTLFSGADDVWGTGNPSNAETAAADAHYGAQVTWDFYKSTFGRSGIRNDGKAAYSRVHYGNNYVNAFWSDSCFCMTYGDGSGNTHPLTSLDVAAHEMSHGLTSATAGLNYSGESGGLNEATSDIFGAGAEFYANNTSDVGDYLIGEKIDIRGDGTPLRYMDKPSKDGDSADAWSAGLGSLDVHYSSGPANHFFYLLSEGSGKKTINGVAYDSPTSNGSTVTGIGRTKALQIWYKALTTYMTSTTKYAAARTATLNAASALYGASSTEYKAVAAAWSAVNVG